MPTDAETPNEKRTSRPLGRGLEEISHLFLSHPPAAAPAASQSARTFVGMARAPQLTKTQIAAALMESRSALAGELPTIGPGIVCSPYGEIDLFAVDRAHQLTLIDVQTTLDDGMVARGLGHIDWTVRNLRTIRRLFPGWAIDLSRQPRLVLVAPRFSLSLRSGIRQIAAPSISCFRYCEMELSGQVGLFIERL